MKLGVNAREQEATKLQADFEYLHIHGVKHAIAVIVID